MTTPFVRRDHEMSVLETAFTASLTGGPQLVLVAGEAGAGKSRLVAEFRKSVDRLGPRVLVGSCLDLGGAIPFAPWADALRGLPLDADWPKVRADLGNAFPGLAALAPALSLFSPDVASNENRPTGTEAIFELAMLGIQRLAERRPLVVVLEDLHWVDRSTVDLLLFLAGNLRRGSVMILLTFRDEEVDADHPLHSLIVTLTRQRVRRVDLSPLDEAGVAEFVEQCVGRRPDIGAVQRLHQRSDGNFFFLEEMLRTDDPDVTAAVPAALGALALERVKAVSSEARLLLNQCAVLTRPLDHNLVERLSQLDSASLEQALRELVGAGALLVDRRHRRYRFRHWLTQHAALDAMLPGEFMAAHAAAANALAEVQLDAGRDLQTAVELSHHWSAAHQPVAAAHAAAAAGQLAIAAQAYPEAQRQFDLVRSLRCASERVRTDQSLSWSGVLEGAAQAERWAGSIRRAAELLSELANQPDVCTDQSRLGLVHEELGRVLWDAGDGDGSLQAFEEAARLLAASGSEGSFARALAAESGALMLLSRYSESQPKAQQAVEVARSVGDHGVASHALCTVGVNLSMNGEVERGLQALRASLELADAACSFDDQCRARTNLTSVLDGAGRLEEAVTIGIEGFERARDRGAELCGGGAMIGNVAWALFRLGRWDQADKLCDELLERLTGPMYVQMALTRIALSLARGEAEDAAAWISKASDISAAINDPQLLGPLRALEAEVAIASGKLDVAERAILAGLRQVGESEDQQLVVKLAAVGVRLWADAVEGSPMMPHRFSDAVRATESAARYLQRAIQAAAAAESAGAAVAEVKLDLAEARGEMSRLEEPAPAVWDVAARGWGELRQPYRQAYALFREAESWLRRRNRKRAATALQESYALCGSLSEARLCSEVEALASRSRINLASGSAAENPALHGGQDRPFGLTPRELQVLRELMEGRSNRQIARRLAITEKTVSVHVSNLFNKLGVRSRTEAAALAHRRQLLDPAVG